MVCIIHNNADKIEESVKLGAEVLSPPKTTTALLEWTILNHTQNYGYGFVHFYCIKNKYII